MTSIVIAVIALLGSIAAVTGQVWVSLRRERRETNVALRGYKEPLISSAYDLQSRLFNILRKNFGVYFADGQRQPEALASTAFAFAQYFGWREILRREFELLEFETQDIGRVLSGITGTFGSDKFGPRFMLWKAEQRGLGEAMIGSWRDRPSCVGYGEFLQRRAKMSKWLEPLERDILDMVQSGESDPRLVEIQHGLVALIQVLDAGNVRYDPKRLSLA